MLSLHDVNKVVQSGDDQLQLLDSISLEVGQGESLAIVGRSGSGKSTLLGLMAGLDRASSGSIESLASGLIV